MAGEITVSEASGMFKKVYDRTVKDLRPVAAIMQRNIPFNERQKVGEEYRISVVVRPPNGFTYAGPSGSVVPLKQPRNMVVKQAALTPFELDLREQVSWAALSRATTDGEGAFKDLLGEIVSGMQVAASHRVEASMLHGQRGYGTVESIADNGDGTMNVVITAATWAPGMWWVIGEGSTWDSFTGTTKNNASGALVLQGVTNSTRTLKFSFTGTAGSEVAAADKLFPEGAYDGTTHSDMPGLLSQVSNTTGTSLGLSALTYGNWKGNSYNVGGAFGLAALEDAISQLRDRGAAAGLSAYLSNRAYAQISLEVAQMRTIDNSYSSEKAKIGQKAISYVSQDVGEVKLINHPFMMQGDVLMLPDADGDVERIGSSDVTFQIPGRRDEFFRLVENYNAAELDNFSDQAVIVKRPSHAMLITGITYT
jgi:hypothetical protein